VAFVITLVAACPAWHVQLVGFQEEVQLREQDWGNFQVCAWMQPVCWTPTALGVQRCRQKHSHVQQS
jgi:hypothetical protein